MTTFVLSVVLAIPLSIVANLLTPVVRDWLASRSAYRRPDRIASIRKQQELLARVRAQPSLAVGELGMTLTRLLPLWAFTVVTSVCSLIADLSTAKGISGLRDALGVAFPLALVYSNMMTGRVLTMFRMMASPDWAEQQAQKQLRKLGAEPKPQPDPEPEPGGDGQPLPVTGK